MSSNKPSRCSITYIYVRNHFEERIQIGCPQQYRTLRTSILLAFFPLRQNSYMQAKKPRNWYQLWYNTDMSTQKTTAREKTLFVMALDNNFTMQVTMIHSMPGTSTLPKFRTVAGLVRKHAASNIYNQTWPPELNAKMDGQKANHFYHSTKEAKKVCWLLNMTASAHYL